MTYTKQTWADGAIGGTPITAARLTHMEEGIYDASVNGGSGVTGAGATGPTGPRGQTGPQGTAGTAGATGAASTVTGPTGPAGAQGTVGAASTVTGPTGPQGVPGTQGDPGTASATGATGPSGAAGATGPTGPSGTAGAASTVTGPAGATGSPGSAGATGATGATGPTGAGSSVKTDTFTIVGEATVGNRTVPLINRGPTRTITGVTLGAGIAPTGTANGNALVAGAALVGDVLIESGGAASSIFGTANLRPVLTSGQRLGAETTGMTVTNWPTGSAITVGVAAVGSTIAGSDITITIEYTS